MNRGLYTTTPHATIMQSIWDGLAIMGTNGSICQGIATYSWIISTTNDEVEQDVKGGGYLPPPAQYATHSSK
jgi:hypothetical protein